MKEDKLDKLVEALEAIHGTLQSTLDDISADIAEEVCTKLMEKINPVTKKIEDIIDSIEDIETSSDVEVDIDRVENLIDKLTRIKMKAEQE